MKDGISHDFVNRDAFAYHAYNLLFYAGILKTVGMYKGKEAAMALYSLKNQQGSSVQSCVKFWEPYLIDPQNNIHLEFVNSQLAPKPVGRVLNIKWMIIIHVLTLYAAR